MIAALAAALLLIQPAPLSNPRVRPTSDVARELIAEASSRSRTVKTLLSALEQSDLYVYVQVTHALVDAGAETVFIAANATGRFVQITIDARREPRRRIELLGHELRHAVEIADAPEVRDSAGMRKLFNGIGWALQHSLAFETDAAVSAERQVSRDLATGKGK